MKSKEEKINTLRGIFKYVLIGLVILIILFTISLKFLIPSDSTKDGFYVTLNGIVKDTSLNSSHLPDYVRVYYPFYFMKNVGEQGKQMDISLIKWTDKGGKFSMSFWVPIPMEVIVTADPEGCNNQLVYVSPIDNVKDIELNFDGSNCKEDYELPETQEELVKKAKEGFDRLFTESANEILSKNETKSIIEDRQKGGEEIEETHNELNENNSLLHAYNAYWILLRGYYKTDLAELRNCVEQALPYITQNQSCVILPHSEKIDILDANLTYYSGLNSWILRERPEEIESIEEAKQTYYNIKTERSRIRAAYYDCISALPVIKESFSEQNPVCEMRKYNLVFIKWSEALALVCLGFVIFYPIRRWIER
jgi:hypothetical protein